MTITIDAPDMWPGNAQAEIANKDLGLFFGLTSTSTSCCVEIYWLQRNSCKKFLNLLCKPVVWHVINVIDVRLSSDMNNVYAYSDTDLGEVLFHKVMLGDKGNRDLSSKIYHKHICALPSTC